MMVMASQGFFLAFVSVATTCCFKIVGCDMSLPHSLFWESAFVIFFLVDVISGLIIVIVWISYM